MQRAIKLTPAIMAQTAYGYSVDLNQSDAHGSFDLTCSNQVANPLTDLRPLQTGAHDADAPTRKAFTAQKNVSPGGLIQDDVSPPSSAMVIEADNDSTKYSCDTDDHVRSRNHDSGATNLSSADHAPEKENAAKFTSKSRAKPSRCDASHNTAQS